VTVINNTDRGRDYHSLLDLHHSIRLRRSLRGEGPHRSDDTDYLGERLAAWPERRDDQRLMRESLPLLEPLTDTLTHLYTSLFATGPHLRALFPGSLAAQRERLAWSLTQLMEHLDSPERLLTMFAEYGRAHRKLGVRAVHYGPFGDAFIAALRRHAGPAWSAPYDAAWLRAYGFLADVMSHSADAALSTPPYVHATVTAHERRGPDLAVLRVAPAGPYDYHAGQYATLASARLPHTWRSYSMAGPPAADGVLEFHVRATGAGQLSDVLVHRTAVGDRLLVGPARGTMTLAAQTDAPVLLIAGGTGLAPLRALLGELAARSAPPPTWLFVGGRTLDDLYDLPTLTRYGQEYPWLRVVPAVAEGEAGPYEQGTVVDVVSRHGYWDGHDAYLAGPASMVRLLTRRLVELGVPADRIRHDQQ